MNKAKVGDKIRIVGDTCSHGLAVGSIHTVKLIRENLFDEVVCYVTEPEVHCGQLYVVEEDYELVEDSTLNEIYLVAKKFFDTKSASNRKLLMDVLESFVQHINKKQQDKLRASALAKLTDEEKKVLGLDKLKMDFNDLVSCVLEEDTAVTSLHLNRAVDEAICTVVLHNLEIIQDAYTTSRNFSTKELARRRALALLALFNPDCLEVKL